MPNAIKKDTPTRKSTPKKDAPIKAESPAPARKSAPRKKAAIAAIAPAASDIQAAQQESPAAAIAHHEVAELAYYFWAQRGWQHGDALGDWLRAEQQLNARKAA